MSPAFWADVILVGHFLFILGILVPIPLIFLGKILRWSWVRRLWLRVTHLAMMALVLLENLLGWACPLTDWENELRLRSGQGVYAKSFVGYWVEHFLYYEWPSWGFTLLYLILAAMIAGLWFWVPPLRGGDKKKPHP